MRKKEAAQIRADALKMGVKKIGSCDGCANAYFDLARANGATEDEIQRVIARQGSPLEMDLSRRQLLKGIAAGVAGSAAVAGGIIPLEAAATSNYYGVDTNTVNCCSMPYSFYIGRFGGQLSQNTNAFSVTAARQTGSVYRVHEYWDLGGPNWPGSGNDKYLWGSSQASAAMNAWSTNPNANLVWGRTIFADVEANEAWDNPINQSNNQDVLQGWIDNVNSNPPFQAGLYISPGNWNSYFGSGYVPGKARGLTLWLTGCKTCSISCAPQYNGCGGTVSQVDSTFANTVSRTVLGGSQVVIWQYWIGCCGYPGCVPGSNCTGCNAGDWDVSPQSGYKTFNPVSSGSTEVISC